MTRCIQILLLTSISSVWGGSHGAKGPTTMSADFDVWAAGGKTVKFNTLLDPKKPVVVHLVTDQCAITEANLKLLDGMATKYPDVQFVAVLRFMNGVTLTEASCPAKGRSNCEADSGSTYKEVAAYLPKGSKVLLVQDMYKDETPKKDPNACEDSSSNCASMLEQGFTCPDLKKQGMIDNCKLTCKVCTPAAAPAKAAAPAFVPPKCCSKTECLTCGGIWNQYGSTGNVQTAWDLKESVAAYGPKGCRLAYVAGVKLTHPDREGKLWAGDTLKQITAAVELAAKGKCDGAAAAAGGGKPAAGGDKAAAGGGAATTTAAGAKDKDKAAAGDTKDKAAAGDTKDKAAAGGTKDKAAAGGTKAPSTTAATGSTSAAPPSAAVASGASSYGLPAVVLALCLALAGLA